MSERVVNLHVLLQHVPSDAFFSQLLMIAYMEPFDDRLMEPPWDRVNGAR